MENDKFFYNMKLKKFLRENDNASEIDFINILISDNQSTLDSILVLSDEDLLNEIESKYSYEQKKQSGYGDYMLVLFETKKKEILRIRQGLINEIEDLEIRKSRLPQKETEIEKDEALPYKIALLNELGFFELDKITKITKVSLYNILKKLTGSPERSIKGNINVLNKESNEDRTKYTAENHIEEVKKYLNKLS